MDSELAPLDSPLVNQTISLKCVFDYESSAWSAWSLCLLMKSSMVLCHSQNKVQHGLPKALPSLVLSACLHHWPLVTLCCIHFHLFSKLQAFAHIILPLKYCSWGIHGLYCYLRATTGFPLSLTWNKNHGLEFTEACKLLCVTVPSY